jgi:hypothetical protein
VAVVVAALLALGASGCSFVFVRPPTLESAREPGACAQRGLATATDATLTALALYRMTYSSDSLLAIREGGLPNDVTLRSTWLGRNGNLVAGGVGVLTVSSMVYGLVETSKCSEMKAAFEKDVPSVRGPAPRPSAPSIRAAPAAPTAGVPQAVPGPSAPPRPSAPQQTDDESTSRP